MTPSPALLTTSIPADVCGWWVSEKFDGVRAIWTGSALMTRNGKRLAAPASFLAGLPKNVRLDGELWMGRGSFDALVSTIQKKGSDWSGVAYMVFDLQGPGTFEERQSLLRATPLPYHTCAVVHTALSGHQELDSREKEIVSAGGEGCVIRKPGSKYLPGRAGITIKVKRMVADVDRWQG